MILRRGHVGQHFYFIYSGSVFVNVEDENSNGDKFTKTEVVFSKGDSFGVSIATNLSYGINAVQVNLYLISNNVFRNF